MLVRDDMKITVSNLKKALLDRGYKEDVRKHVDYFKSRVAHACDTLESQNFIIKQNGRSGGGIPGIYVGITNAGRSELKIKYRLWRWVKNDFQAALAILALLIGLLAFFGLDWNWFVNLWQ